MLSRFGEFLSALFTVILFIGGIFSLSYHIHFKSSLKSKLTVLIAFALMGGFLYNVSNLNTSAAPINRKILKTTTYKLNPITIDEKNYYAITNKDTIEFSIDNKYLENSIYSLTDIKIIDSDKAIAEKQIVSEDYKLTPSNFIEKVFAKLFFTDKSKVKSEIVIYIPKDTILQK